MGATTSSLKQARNFNEQEQKLILIQILEEAKIQLNIEELQTQISTVQQILKTKTIKHGVEAINLLLAEFEHIKEAESVIDFLKEKGLYRMLYRFPKFMGQELLPKDDILNDLMKYGFIGVGVSVVFIAAFVATLLLSAPFWAVAISSALFVGASVYLSGILYGVVNDLFATHANLPYFLLGHQSQQKSLLRTNDKIAQGIAWGVAATFGPVVIATIVFTVAALITAFFVPMAHFILPIMMIAMPLIAVGAEIYARVKTKEYSENPPHSFFGSNGYQMDGLAFMSPTMQERGAWFANSDRNMFGFTGVPIIGLIGLGVLLVLSGVSMFLPAVLFFSPIIAVIVPAAFAGATALFLGCAGLYTYINRNRQIDDRYNLEFERESVNYELYLDEDMDYATELLQKNSEQRLEGIADGSSIHYPPLFMQDNSDEDKKTSIPSTNHTNYSSI